MDIQENDKPKDMPRNNDHLPLIQKDKEESKESTSTLISFCVLGFLVTSAFVVMLSAAQDILTGTSIPTSIVLIANRGPSSLTSLVAAYFMKRIPYSVRYIFVFTATAGGFLITGLVHHVGWKLAGVAIASFGNGVASISSIALASFFHVKALSMYSSGTGIGFIAAPFYYTAITTWFCVTPKLAILLYTPIACLYLVAYVTINRNMPKTDAEPESVALKNYSKLIEEDGNDTVKKRIKIDAEKTRKEPANVEQNSEYLTTKEKLSVIVEMMLKCFVPVFIGFFSQYMLLQAVITTISYQNAPFPPRDHYQYYIFIYMVGEFLGRCHRSFLRFMTSQLLYEETWLKLWLVSMAQAIHVVFFALESWYRFLPGVGLALFFTFTAGLAVGILFNNMLEYLSVALDGKKREFMLGYVSFPMFCGSFVAALVGISVEDALKKHCQSIISDNSFCLTRASSFVNFTSSCH